MKTTESLSTGICVDSCRRFFQRTCKKHLKFIDSSLRYSCEMDLQGEKCAGGGRVGILLTSNGNHIKCGGVRVLSPHTTFHVGGERGLKSFPFKVY